MPFPVIGYSYSGSVMNDEVKNCPYYLTPLLNTLCIAILFVSGSGDSDALYYYCTSIKGYFSGLRNDTASTPY